MTSPDAINAPPTQRRIVKRARGQGGGPITRLMSPSDLGETLKPFVFLDIINMDDSTFNEIGEMPPHDTLQEFFPDIFFRQGADASGTKRLHQDQPQHDLVRKREAITQVHRIVPIVLLP